MCNTKRYGVNFGYPDIPAHLRKRVSARRYKGIPVAKGTVAVLEGCCNSTTDKGVMNLLATNGRRGLLWNTVEVKRGLDVGFWHFLWVYSPR